VVERWLDARTHALAWNNGVAAVSGCQNEDRQADSKVSLGIAARFEMVQTEEHAVSAKGKMQSMKLRTIELIQKMLEYLSWKASSMKKMLVHLDQTHHGELMMKANLILERDQQQRI
jgi:hypothetical protein